MKRVVSIGLWAVAIVIVAALVFGVAALGFLIAPGRPSESKTLTFDGYIDLPKEGALNVLDYLTLRCGDLFVTSESSGDVLKVSLDENRPSRSRVQDMRGSGSVHGVAIVPGTNLAFVTRSEANTVDAFDTGSLNIMARIPVAEDADAIIYDPVDKLIYVANGEAKLATLIDPSKLQTVGTISLPGNPEFAAFDPKTGRIYQNLKNSDSMAAINVRTLSVTDEWPLAGCEGPSGMAIDVAQRRLFAVCSGNAKLVVFDLDRHRIVTTLKVGGGPDSVAFDPQIHRIYCAGKSGELTVIDQQTPDLYRLLDEIDTHYGAHTLAVDPVSHRVFVAYASLFAHPKIAVFTPKL